MTYVLPQGWSKGGTPEGRAYYSNDVQRTTQWTQPALVAVNVLPGPGGPQPGQGQAPLPPGWTQSIDPGSGEARHAQLLMTHDP